MPLNDSFTLRPTVAGVPPTLFCPFGVTTIRRPSLQASHHLQDPLPGFLNPSAVYATSWLRGLISYRLHPWDFQPLKFLPFEDSSAPLGAGYSPVVRTAPTLLLALATCHTCFQEPLEKASRHRPPPCCAPSPQAPRSNPATAPWRLTPPLHRASKSDRPITQRTAISEATHRLRSFKPLENPTPPCEQAGRDSYDLFL